MFHYGLGTFSWPCSILNFSWACSKSNPRLLELESPHPDYVLKLAIFRIFGNNSQLKEWGSPVFRTVLKFFFRIFCIFGIFSISRFHSAKGDRIGLWILKVILLFVKGTPTSFLECTVAFNPIHSHQCWKTKYYSLLAWINTIFWIFTRFISLSKTFTGFLVHF